MEGLQRIRIGVYDSGIGGLTVLKQLLTKIPFGIDFFISLIQHGYPMARNLRKWYVALFQKYSVFSGI